MAAAPIVRLGTPHRLLPVSREFGADRGSPIDRYYIEDFLRRNSGASEYTPGAIHGHVLEVGDDKYSRQFGLGVDRVDILDASPENPQGTVVADVADGSNLPPETYDCVICTQMLLLIYDVKAPIRTIHRILKPGGTALVTVPGISQICRPDIDSWGTTGGSPPCRRDGSSRRSSSPRTSRWTATGTSSRRPDSYHSDGLGIF